MTRFAIRSGWAALLLLVATAVPALADPIIERVDTEVTRNRRLTVTIEATFAGRGELRLEGDVNGKRVRKRKKVRRAGTARLRVKLDAKKLRLRRLRESLVFDVNVVAAERDGSSVERPVQETVPVPVVLLGGLGNELGNGGMDAFALALDVAAGGVHSRDGAAPSLLTHEYASLETSLSELGKELNKTVRAALRGTSFAQVDVVGYSMGGLVARRWLADQGAGKVRRMVFLATPNQGAPLAQIAGIALESDLLEGALGELVPGLGDASGLGDLLGGVLDSTLDPDTLRVFYPTYDWAFATVSIPFLGEQRISLTSGVLDTFGALLPEQFRGLDFTLDSPLAPLNDAGPDGRATFHAIGYTALPTELLGIDIGTLDEIDLGGLITGGEEFDPLTLANGEGDGLVPWRSLVMADTPGWAEAMEATDLGVGTHVTLLADPRCIARVAEILAE